MRVLVRNYRDGEVIAVNHAIVDGLKLYIQDVVGGWHCIQGFINSAIISYALRQLFYTGFYDFTDYETVIHKSNYDWLSYEEWRDC